MRQVSSAAAALPLYIHDGFNLEQYSQFVADRSDFVVQDHHSYFVFTPQDNAESASGHTKDIQSSISGSLASASDRQRRNLVVDEFSCALTEQSLSGEADPNQARRAFCEGQLQIYQNETAGWSFWGALLVRSHLTSILIFPCFSVQQRGLFQRPWMVFQGGRRKQSALLVLLLRQRSPRGPLAPSCACRHGGRHGLSDPRGDDKHSV